MKRTIKGIRSDLGLTQEELAKELGISTQSMRNKESYRNSLTVKELLKLAVLANIDPRDIAIEK